MSIATLLLLVASSGVTQATDISLPTWADTQKREPIKWPKTFHGLILNEQKQPIDKATVVLQLEAQLYAPGGGIVERKSSVLKHRPMPQANGRCRRMGFRRFRTDPSRS